jgi:tocopherol cyclase
MRRFVRTTLSPAAYHGHGKKPPFFEGWYYKVVDAGEQHRYAIIPGIFLSDDPDRHHAFVQVLDGRTGQTTYHRYPADQFWAADGVLDLRIGPNRFTPDGLSVQIDTPELAMSGELHFGPVRPWPVTLTSPGIMGWYAWMPFMECYHGVVSLDHGIDGRLTVNGQTIDFGGGRGYTEKDWGQAFPQAWIWYQTNHFDQPGISLTCSAAIIPWIRRSFPGFIAGLWHDGVLYRFATYTGAAIERLELTDRQATLAVRNKRYRLEMVATRAEGGLLHAPTTVDMGRRIAETLTATVEVRLTEVTEIPAGGPRRGRPGGRTLFQGTGRHAGMEAVGNLERLAEMAQIRPAAALGPSRGRAKRNKRLDLLRIAVFPWSKKRKHPPRTKRSR